MTDFILVVVLAVIIGGAARYVYKAKKSGAKCIGCSVGEGGCCCSAATAEAASDCGCGRGCDCESGKSCH